jgi:uncharacterized membrane protein YqiK
MMIMVISSVTLVIAIFVVMVVLMMIFFATQYKTVPPNKAMLFRDGRSGDEWAHAIVGGGRFVLPGSAGFDIVPLDVRYMDLVMSGLRTTSHGVDRKAALKAVVVYKVTSHQTTLLGSAKHLVGKTHGGIAVIVKERMEARAREMFQDMDYERIAPDRDTLRVNVQRYMSVDLMSVGIEIRDFHLHMIRLQS